MKKIKFLLLSLALIAGVCTANAEEGQHAVGFNFGYATGCRGINNFGIGIKYDYGFSDNLRVEPSFMYYFENKKIDMKDANINFHYLFDLGNEQTHLYPIFGFSTLFGKEKDVLQTNSDGTPKTNSDGSYKYDSDKFFRFGCNLGMGFQYDITSDFGIVVEAKYKLCKNFGQLDASVGCVVTF